MDKLLQTARTAGLDLVWLNKLHGEELISEDEYKFLVQYITSKRADSGKIIEIMVCRFVDNRIMKTKYSDAVIELLKEFDYRIADESLRMRKLAMWMFYYDFKQELRDGALFKYYGTHIHYDSLNELVNIISNQVPEIVGVVADISKYKLNVDNYEFKRSKDIFESLNLELRSSYEYILSILELERAFNKLAIVNDVLKELKKRLPEFLAVKFLSCQIQVSSENGEILSLLSSRRSLEEIAEIVIDNFMKNKY